MIERLVIRNAVNSNWLVFTQPIDVVLTRKSRQVLDVLKEIERRVNEENLFAAGFLSYEAASGFDPAFVTHPGDRLPLICFGLFPEVQQIDDLVQPDCEPQEPMNPDFAQRFTRALMHQLKTISSRAVTCCY